MTTGIDDGAGAPRRIVLADHVQDAILDRLFSGELAAGSAIRIETLARDLEVSATPVREALARLESTGMVRRTALRGYRVAPEPDVEELTELMDARLVIEPVLARLACQHATDDVVADLRIAFEGLRDAPRGGSPSDIRALWEADERFHLAVARASRNQFLLAAYDALGGIARRFRQFGDRGVTDADDALDEHRAILAAFEDGDADGARAAMIRHLEAARRRSLLDSIARDAPASTDREG